MGESAHASPYRKKGLQGAGALVIDKGVEQYGQVSAAHFLLDVFERRRQARKLCLVSDILKSQGIAIYVCFVMSPEKVLLRVQREGTFESAQRGYF
jgi:hypothetical protein